MRIRIIAGGRRAIYKQDAKGREKRMDILALTAL